MNPSSSTETESGPQPTLVRRNVPRRGLRESFPRREPPQYDTVYEDTKHDYEKDLPEPSSVDQLIALITLGKVFNQKTVYIAKPAAHSRETGTASAPWHGYISALVVDLTTSIMFWFTAVFALLLGGINGILGVTERATEIKRNRAERRARKKMLVKFNQDFRNKFPDGNVLVVARNTMCLQIDKRILLERAPGLLQGAEITLMLLPYLRKVHLVRLNRSAQKVENFLRYLNCNIRNPGRETWWREPTGPTKFDIAGLYCMAREYEHPNSYGGRFERFSGIRDWMVNNPLEVFATLCRASNIDYSLVEEAILCLDRRLSDDDPSLRSHRLPRTRWLTHEISAAKLQSLDLSRKMHDRYIRAYDASHQYIRVRLAMIKEAQESQGHPRYTETLVRDALIVLADEFLRAAGHRECAQVSVTDVGRARYRLNSIYGPGVTAEAATAHS